MSASTQIARNPAATFAQANHPVSAAALSLGNHDRFLVQKCEEAIRDGIALEQWCRAGGGSSRRDFALAPGEFRLHNRAEGYFDSVHLSGGARSVMGCR